MPIDLPDDYWIDIPACTYTLGVTPEEARIYGETAAAYTNALPLPDYDAWKEVDEREHYSGNPDYLADWVLRMAPARTVHIPAFSIARRPVSNTLYRRFLDETGRAEEDPAIRRGTQEPDGAVEERGWSEIEAFMAWSGHRVPFEDEWERAARGLERHLFPWGNDFDDRGARLVDAILRGRLDVSRPGDFAGPGGFVALSRPSGEWCADLWQSLIPGFSPSLPWERERHTWARTLRGGMYTGFATVLVERTSGATESDGGMGAMFRLVKHNGRVIPAAPPMTGWSGARGKVRDFERTVARPALEGVRRELELHRTFIWTEDGFPRDLGTYASRLATSLEKTAGARVDPISTAYFYEPTRPAYGMTLAAVTMESFRRVANDEHGVFLWALVYRLDAEERVLAHPVAFYHMAWDRQWHRFDDQFRPGEDDTPIGEITAAMIADHVRESFRLYEEYADADNPPPSGRRETRTPPLPVFRTR
ncbi:MAG TPA: SUMF1/EgtB/PvdO family nonheme iron enzyme [Kofleriaceae bacterium]|nr:SUMF1/EgtB/PvdO family nonheme iron enzyme [Kofleriaceae bacterium]